MYLNLLLFASCALVTLAQNDTGTSTVLPCNFTTFTAHSTNGSSVNGNCSNFYGTVYLYAYCLAPNTSVLFDGHIPMLTGQDNMWARALLTLRTRGYKFEVYGGFHVEDVNDVQLSFNFSRSYRMESMHVSVFNCPPSTA